MRMPLIVLSSLLALCAVGCEYRGHMPLPDSREETATGASPVSSNTINALQDAIIGKKHGPVTRLIWPRFAIGPWTPTQILTEIYNLSTAGADGYAMIETSVGDEITGFSWEAYGDGAVDVDYQLFVLTNHYAGITNLVAPATDTNRAAAWGDVAPTVTPHMMAAGEVLYFKASPNAANARIGHAQLTYHRP